MSLVLSPQLPPTPVSLLPLSTKVRSRVPAVVYRIYCAAQQVMNLGLRLLLGTFNGSMEEQVLTLP